MGQRVWGVGHPNDQPPGQRGQHASSFGGARGRDQGKFFFRFQIRIFEKKNKKKHLFFQFFFRLYDAGDQGK